MRRSYNGEQLVFQTFKIWPVIAETVKMARLSGAYRRRSNKVRRFELPGYIACWGIFFDFPPVESVQLGDLAGSYLLGSGEANVFRATKRVRPCGGKLAKRYLK